MSLISVKSWSDKGKNDTEYNTAISNMNSGDYLVAAALLNKLKGYKDSVNLMKESYYLLAVQNYEKMYFSEAFFYFSEADGYGDTDKYLNSTPLNIVGTWKPKSNDNGAFRVSSGNISISLSSNKGVKVNGNTYTWVMDNKGGYQFESSGDRCTVISAEPKAGGELVVKWESDFFNNNGIYIYQFVSK